MEYVFAAEEGIEYKPRWLSRVLERATLESDVVVLSGARQVGKSTMLKREHFFDEWRYVTLDDYESLEAALSSPTSLWGDDRQTIVDEVQKAPRLLHGVKAQVDLTPQDYRFVLSGSANLLLMKQATESLAGRARYITLGPMTHGEWLGWPAPSCLEDLLEGRLPQAGANAGGDPLPLMVRGFSPFLLRFEKTYSATSFVDWWGSYVATYAERDLRQLSQIESLPDFARLMRALALRSGALLNQSEIARDLRLQQPTIGRHINLLETSHLIRRVPALRRSRTSRLIKSPKLYYFDPGLASWLCGHHSADALRESPEAGSVFETMVLLHLDALAQLMSPRPAIHYWRTTSGKEVDFVIEHGRRLLPMEVKLSDRPSYRDAENLRGFMAEYPQADMGVLVHAGSQMEHLDKNVLAVPWTVLAGA